jgi:hypothetical protein
VRSTLVNRRLADVADAGACARNEVAGSDAEQDAGDSSRVIVISVEAVCPVGALEKAAEANSALLRRGEIGDDPNDPSSIQKRTRRRCTAESRCCYFALR